jgi:GNAT superfamily N-acetyltransferase
MMLRGESDMEVPRDLKMSGTDGADMDSAVLHNHLPKTRLLTDKAEILAFLETDRLYAAYAIGDLEPGMYEQCTWAGAERAGRLQAIVLHYCGLEPPALFLMGRPDDVREVLRSQLCPQRVYLTCREEHLEMTREFYTWDEVEPMWRMVLQSPHFRPAQGASVRLGPAHLAELQQLYAHGGADAFNPYQLEQGVFHGTWSDGRLVAAAGTHLVSSTYGVAAVGNVFTHPHYRRRGLAAATTGAVVAELLQRGIRNVILNVGQGNRPAIRAYERLGFHRHCPFLEGCASRLPNPQ